MNTIRTLGKWWVPLAGIYLILVAIGLLFSVAVPAVLLGVVALLAGIFALFAS